MGKHGDFWLRATIVDPRSAGGKCGADPFTGRTGPGVVPERQVRHNGGMVQPTPAPVAESAAESVRVTGRWSSSVTPVPPLRANSPTVRFLLYAGFFTGAWAGVLSLIVLGIGRGLGVHLIEPQGVPAWVQAFPWLAVILVPLGCGLLGALGASLVRGWRHAAAWVWVAGTGIAVVSLAGPLTSETWSSRIMLTLMHLITWFLVVPQLARIVGDSEPEASVDQRD